MQFRRIPGDVIAPEFACWGWHDFPGYLGFVWRVAGDYWNVR
jgi:hypothetical protein